MAKITVKAAATANYTSASKVITMTVNPAKPAITGIVDKRQGMVQLKWKASKQLSGYEIQYTTGTSFKNAKKVNISGGSKASSLIENLKKGKTYRFRLRSYKLAGEKKLYSAWSGTKKIILKK